MKKVALFLLLAPIVVAQAPTPSVNGKWKVHQSVAGNESDSICTFVQKDTVLTGSCAGDQGKMELKGTVEGTKVKWSYKTDYNGTELTVSYSGTLAANKITGDTTVDPFGISGDFSAVPAPDTK